MKNLMVYWKFQAIHMYSNYYSTYDESSQNAFYQRHCFFDSTSLYDQSDT